MLVFTVHRKVHMHVYIKYHNSRIRTTVTRPTDGHANCRGGHRGRGAVLSVLTVITHPTHPAPSIRNVVRERASHIFLAHVELTARVRLQLGRLDRVDFCSEAPAARRQSEIAARTSRGRVQERRHLFLDNSERTRSTAAFTGSSDWRASLSSSACSSERSPSSTAGT